MREEFERDRARRGLTPSQRQNAPTEDLDVVFDVFINAISANMSYEGGWVTYVVHSPRLKFLDIKNADRHVVVLSCFPDRAYVLFLSLPHDTITRRIRHAPASFRFHLCNLAFRHNSDTQIYDQIQVLNKGFEGTGISFRHNMTTRIISQEWFDGITFPDTDEL